MTATTGNHSPPRRRTQPMSSEMFYPSGDDVDRMIELAIQCGIDNRGTSWPLELCHVRAKLRTLLARTEAGAGGGAPICLFDATNPCDGTCGECHHLRRSPRDAAPVADGELPGMWSASDFTGGDPDERSHRERADSSRLDWITANRVAVYPELDGPWYADVYRDGEEGEVTASHHAATPREAIDAAMRQEGE